ncbi:MAG: VanZ family protein [Oscillospiraceae bacterium]|nr:VanZ family protein [Oscillospiraceae bacterium]
MEEKQIRFLRFFLAVIFIAYIILLLYLTMCKNVVLVKFREREVSLIPFRATVGVIRYMAPLRIIENIGGNILLFVPFGFIPPIISRLKKRIILYGAIFSIAIETAQFIFALGLTDIDDVIYNTLGTAIGFLAAHLLKLKIGRELSVLKTAAAAVLICGAAGISAMAYEGLF